MRLFIDRDSLHRHPGQHPHSFEKAKSIGSFVGERLPLVERLLKLISVDLYPFATQQRESLPSFEQLFEFGLAQRLTIDRYIDFEVQGLN